MIDQNSLPGKVYRPANSDDGLAFVNDWCRYCQRDKAMREDIELDECDDNELCEIIAASFRGEATEWRETEKGFICTEFVPAGDQLPYRCQITTDLFKNENANDL